MWYGLPHGAQIIIAKFMRHKSPLWFKIHRAVQSVGLLFVVAAFIIAVSAFNVFKAGHAPMNLVHGLIGMVVMLLGVLQPINAFFRPHATNPVSVIEPSQPQTPLCASACLCVAY